MSLVEAWNHKWFGLWKETRPEYSNYPSIKEFLTGASLSPDELENVIRYLDSGVIIATTSRRAFPCVMTGRRFSGSLSERTDGVWWWTDDLSYYIREFGVRLPNQMLDHIRKNNYTIPEVSHAQIQELEQPS